MHLKTRVGIQIKTIRERRGHTQAALAELVGVSQDAISQIERGISAASFPTLERIAGALGIPVRDLFDVASPDSSPDRIAKLSTIMDIARALPDRDLDIAIRQMAALESRDQDR